MGLFFDILAIAVGLALGGVGGYAMGSHWRDDHRILWPAAVGAFVLACVLNFLGRIFGLEWLAIGAIGLMAGVISGVKYGGFPDVRVWEKPPDKPSEEPSEVADANDAQGTNDARDASAVQAADVVQAASDAPPSAHAAAGAADGASAAGRH